VILFVECTKRLIVLTSDHTRGVFYSISCLKAFVLYFTLSSLKSEFQRSLLLRIVSCGTVFRWLAVCCLSYFPVGVSVVIGKGKQRDRGYGALEKNMEFGLFSWLVSWHSHCKLQLT
jgi:hypothetical protein